MAKYDIATLLETNAYPGRGIILGRSADDKYAVAAYFIMGRSTNSRNRIFTETEDGIKTEAFDPAAMEDPSLIIYHPVRELNGQPVGGKSLEAIEQKAKDATRHLLSNYIDTLSMGQSEGILRMIPGTAQRTIESYYSSKTPNSMNLSYIKAKVKKLQRRYPVETLEEEFGMPLEDVLETFEQKNRNKWQERRRLLFKLVDLEHARKKGGKNGSAGLSGERS